MAERLLFVGTYEIPSGEYEAWQRANQEMMEFVRANEPRVLGFWNYANAERTEVSTVHLHPDSASLEFHLEAARTRISAGTALVKMKRLELYGPVSEKLMAQLRAVSERSGTWPIHVKDFVQGFTPESSAAE